MLGIAEGAGGGADISEACATYASDIVGGGATTATQVDVAVQKRKLLLER